MHMCAHAELVSMSSYNSCPKVSYCNICMWCFWLFCCFCYICVYLCWTCNYLMNIFTYFPPFLLMYMKHATMHWQRREEKSDRTKPFSHWVLGGGWGERNPKLLYTFCWHVHTCFIIGWIIGTEVVPNSPSWSTAVKRSERAVYIIYTS